MGIDWQSNTCPTPLKSPKSRTNSAYCVHFQNKRSQGLCNGCKRCPRQCVVSKAWHVQTEDAFLARLHGKKSKLAAICRKCNVCTFSIIYPQLHGLTNVRRHIVSSTKVKKNCAVPLIGDLQNCRNQSPSSFAKIRRLYNCSTPFPRPGATDPPCQAPGLCSFITNFIVPQVDVCDGRVDFQCFRKGL